MNRKEIKSKNLNTLFSRFILIFVLLTMIIVTITIFNFIFEKQKQKLYELESQTNYLKLLFLNDNILIDNFFISDLINYDFHINKKSHNLTQRDSIQEIISKNLDFINKKYKKYNNEDTTIITIENLFTTYQLTLDSIFKLSLLRGFQDYGYEGIMRYYAHEIEHLNYFPTWKILMLRRHEKDYIIRLNKEYIDLFYKKMNTFQNDVYSSHLETKKKDTLINYLNLYLYNFNQIVHYDSILGIKTNTGLTLKLRISRSQIQNNIDKLTINVEKYILKTEKKLEIFHVLLSTILILASFIAGLLIIRYLTRPISRLSTNIKTLIESNFEETENFEYQTQIAEIVVLIESYFQMKKQILSLLNDFQVKVKERTYEVETQKEELEKQKIKLEEINNNFLSSLEYAKQIQQAILPKKELLEINFKEYLLIFKPKDIVSGDFLWFRSIKNENFNIKLLAVADCTGHGVPGALMSMFSIAYINEIVLRKEVIHANEVLEILRINIISNFNHDGLDIAFIIIHTDKKIIEFSGANRNIFIKRNGEIIKIKGNKMPIGKYPINNLFDNQTFEYQKNDVLFAFTDGISDQFNDENQKFGSKKLINIIQSEDSLKNIKERINVNFENWRYNLEQTDDVLVFAARLS